MTTWNLASMPDQTGRIAIVTGAGRGIGRVTALALARRGAKVLVNDYGGGASTAKPGGSEVASAVVEEIRALGSEAVSSIQRYDTATGLFNTAVFREDGQAAGIDFAIVPGEGYFVFMKAFSTD